MRPSVLCERSLLLVALTAFTACGTATPPTPPPCTYSLAASASSFTPSGGTGTVTVTTATGCTWSARADAGWMSITSGSSGAGPGTAVFTVATNADTARRSGTLTIAGQTVTIEQEAAAVACTYAINPQGATATKDGGTNVFAITTDSRCGWTATSSASWLTLAASSGSGSGSIGYIVARNDQTAARSATITAGGQTFTLTQAGDAGACQYSVTAVEFSPCMASVTLTSDVSAPAGCAWTAAPADSWITIVAGASGSGSGTIRFKVDDNYNAPRRGTVQVRWPTPTAGQNLHIAQAGCSYAVSRDALTFTAPGGASSFDVLQQSDPYTCGGPLQNACVWSAVADSPWVVVTSAMPRAGDDRVSFTVQPNTSGVSRSATITVRDKLVRITQGG